MDGFTEVRADVDPSCNPDIVADMRALGEIGPFDAVLCVHALEHVYPQEVGVVLREFHRVLREGGAVVIFVPDLEGVQATEEVLMVTPAGPVSGMDLIYGHRQKLAENPHMAHHTGFVRDTLRKALEAVGFRSVDCKRLQNFNLFGAAVK